MTSIIHTASPVTFSLKTWDEFVGPAVAGVTGILGSALEHAGPGLESFVLTSSAASVVNPFKPGPYTFGEQDWNTWAKAKAQEMGDETPATVLYPASKAEAERAMWAWRDEHKVQFISILLEHAV